MLWTPGGSDCAYMLLYRQRRPFDREAGGWSAATTELLADASRLRAWRDQALAAYRSRCDPVALLRQADAWNERPRGDL